MKKIVMGALLGAAMMMSMGVQARPAKSPDVQLAEAIAGRTAGKPVNCIDLSSVRSSRIIDGTAIVYQSGNGTLYVNRPASGANWLRRDNILFTRTSSSQLCNVDIVQLLDSSSRMPMGSVGLGQFVPYPKPARSAG